MQAASDLIRQGRLDEALKALQAHLRQNPEDVSGRLLLFGLDCVLGRWEKALSHLDAIASLNPDWTVTAESYRRAIQAELRREQVFLGKAKPVVLGEPAPWIAWCVQAMASESAGDSVEAWDLRNRAWEESPACRASVGGQTVPWLADGDLRMGPILEAFLDGEYYWIPFNQLQKWETKPPAALVELVWIPATIRLITGGEMAAFLPTRYPGTPSEESADLRLGRRTEWRRAGAGNVGIGQKLLESEGVDFAMLECRSVEFTDNPDAQ